MRRKQQRGSAMVEFTLAGIAAIFLLICTFHVAMAMWNYHTLASAVHEATRYVAVKGVNCTKPGNSCSVSVGTIAHQVEALSMGVPSDSLIVTLTTDSGGATSCSPLSSCFSNATIWPPSTNSDNRIGRYITISAIYQFHSPLLFFWPGAGSQRFGEIWLPATSSQQIIF
jgi:hypothetical protein